MYSVLLKVQRILINEELITYNQLLFWDNQSEILSILKTNYKSNEEL